MPYKVRNVTKKLDKRHPFYNSPIELTYKSGFKNLTTSIIPNQEIILDTKEIPVSIKKLNLKKLIEIETVSEKEFFQSKKKDDLIKDLKNKVKSPITQKLEYIEKWTKQQEEKDKKKDEEDSTSTSKSTKKSTSSSTKSGK
ncbi:MAG: hypothetical protein ACOCVF_03235 [bacterium]